MAMGDRWLSDYEAALQLAQDTMQSITERNREQKGSSSHAKKSAHIRTAMRQYNSDINTLRQNLMRATSLHHITQREAERRQGLVDTLVTKEKQLEQALKDEGPANYGRGALLAGSSHGGASSYDQPTDYSSNLDFGEIRQQHQQVIREQDEGLDVLSSVIGRQKQMALDIGNEVDTQDHLIEDISDRTLRTDQRLRRETQHIKLIDRKSATCALWVVIILLFVAIIVIVAVPYKGKAK